jgi:hypothetical protein
MKKAIEWLKQKAFSNQLSAFSYKSILGFAHC